MKITAAAQSNLRLKLRLKLAYVMAFQAIPLKWYGLKGHYIG